MVEEEHFVSLVQFLMGNKVGNLDTNIKMADFNQICMHITLDTMN